MGGGAVSDVLTRIRMRLNGMDAPAYVSAWAESALEAMELVVSEIPELTTAAKPPAAADTLGRRGRENAQHSAERFCRLLVGFYLDDFRSRSGSVAPPDRHGISFSILQEYVFSIFEFSQREKDAHMKEVSRSRMAGIDSRRVRIANSYYGYVLDRCLEERILSRRWKGSKESTAFSAVLHSSSDNLLEMLERKLEGPPAAGTRRAAPRRKKKSGSGGSESCLVLLVMALAVAGAMLSLVASTLA